VEQFRARSPRRRDRLADYERLLASGWHRGAGEEVLACRYQPAPPREAWLNKVGGRRKRVFQYAAEDELLFRVVNRLLQPAGAEAASPWCRSFLPGGGARVAFRGVLADRDVTAKAALRLDIHDYFNAIDVHDLLARLPVPFANGPTAALLERALLDRRVERGGAVVDGGPKGVMAGTPLAPLLATLYLRDVDHEIAGSGATYARYSDDFIVLAEPVELPAIERLLRARLVERGLVVNETKSKVSAPGEAWDFLGFRFESGAIGLAPVTEQKVKAKATRLARRLLRWRERNDVPPSVAIRAFVRRTNRRLYGVPTERADFSWSTWFLPMLDRPDALAGLDAHVQREARYAATGRRNGRARALVPYAMLAEAGYLPLVTAFWAQREGAAAYDQLLTARTSEVRRDDSGEV
jgi:hypothetical protein